MTKTQERIYSEQITKVVVMVSKTITKATMMRPSFLLRDLMAMAMAMAQTTVQSLQVPNLNNLPRSRKAREVVRGNLPN